MLELRYHQLQRERGAAAVEFTLGASFFDIFLFGRIEIPRALYLRSTLVEVLASVSRIAAFIDPMDTSVQAAPREKAMLSIARMQLAGIILTKDNLVGGLSNAAMAPVAPHCPSRSVNNCNAAPSGPSCIRFVRVRVCGQGGGMFSRMPYQPFARPAPVPPLPYPTFAAGPQAGTLGHNPGRISTCN